MSDSLIWRRPQALDQLQRELAEDVVMGDQPPLLGLDPLPPQPVAGSPELQPRPQPQDVEKGPLAPPPPDLGPVVMVEVAVDRDPAGLREGDRLPDLAALEVAFDQRILALPAGRAHRASLQTGR